MPSPSASSRTTVAGGYHILHVVPAIPEIEYRDERRHSQLQYCFRRMLLAVLHAFV
jgi:hypothetical protein